MMKEEPIEPLMEPPERGYPDDFLLARIKGRGAVMGYADSASYAQGPMPEMEHAWVYLRMSRGVLGSMRMFFIHSELKRVFIALRYSSRGKSVPGIAGLFRGSVLSEGFISAICSPSGCTGALGILNRALGLGSLSPALCASDIAGNAGLVKLEHEVYARVIAEGASSASDPVREYFAYMADRYNLLSLIKAIRLGMERVPGLVKGGGFGRKVLMRAFDERRGDLLAGYARRLTGNEISGSAASVHLGFTRGLLRRTKRLERAQEREGAMIAHLVRATVFAENRRLSGISQAPEPDLMSEPDSSQRKVLA